MSYQSLHQMPSLTSASKIESCNLIIICNELMEKYFCLIRIFSDLLIILS